MTNFLAAMTEFKAHDAVIQLPEVPEANNPAQLAARFSQLLADPGLRQSLARNALAVMENNRGAVSQTLAYLKPLIAKSKDR
jgi:3-deoxy-D-manno-octulosonic-acid transferase